MAANEKWAPTRAVPTFQPNQALITAQQGEVRRRKSSRSRRYIPAAFTWLKIMAWLNLAFAGVIVFWMVAKPKPSTDSYNEGELVLGGLFFLMFVFTPIAVLRRWKMGFYLGLVANIPALLAFPIGTVIALITCKAFLDSKSAFGVR